MKTEIEEELKQRNKELLILNTIISFVNQFLNVGELLENSLEKVLEIMTIESGALLLLNEKKDVFLLETSKGFSPDFVSKMSRIDAEESIIGRTICSGNQIMLGEGNTLNKETSEWLYSQDFNTLLCLPIKTKKRVYGMMMCGHRYSLFFNKRNASILENIGYQIAISIENAL
ncbi:MAG: GAF domain-containing protein, partial [Deltaproteobacteria bacterium]|nr:GAF domain-containing protein [Deltaproteobacteria bacterium]